MTPRSIDEDDILFPPISYLDILRNRKRRYDKDRYEANRPREIARAAANNRKRTHGMYTPAWADKAAINAIYEEAHRRRQAGEDVEVDHIVPVRGKDVTGFHVHNNLRIIPKELNRSKGNR